MKIKVVKDLEYYMKQNKELKEKLKRTEKTFKQCIMFPVLLGGKMYYSHEELDNVLGYLTRPVQF